MGVYIKGMERPKSCEECQTVLGCCDELEDGTVWCRLAHGYIGDDRTVCPIASVPPHGDLIERDKLREVMFIGEQCLYSWDEIEDAIDYAPTILPADPAEEG